MLLDVAVEAEETLAREKKLLQQNPTPRINSGQPETLRIAGGVETVAVLADGAHKDDKDVDADVAVARSRNARWKCRYRPTISNSRHERQTPMTTRALPVAC
jgi:hypothetical protein